MRAERLIRSTFVSDSKIMRFLKVTMICLGGLVLTLILTEVLSSTLGYFLFSSGFFGLNYDSAFPLAIGKGSVNGIDIFFGWEECE